MANSSNFTGYWEMTLSALGEKFSKTITNTWFSDLELIYLDDKYAVLLGDTAFKCDIVRNKYRTDIEEKFSSVLGFQITVYIYSRQEGGMPGNFKDLDPSLPPPPPPGNEEEESKPGDVKFPDRYKNDPAFKEFNFLRRVTVNQCSSIYTFDNFIVGNSNSFAYAACKAVADNPANAYNPLFVYGQSGLGKTHLLYAVTNEILAKHPDVKMVYTTCEEFLNELIEAISKRETSSFRDKYRACDVLLIDDIQNLSGKDTLQEEFFNTFNSLYESNKQIIITSDRPPKDIKTLETRLRSRFEWGLIADVQPPDYELRIAILKYKSEKLGFKIPLSVQEFLAHQLQDNVRQIEGVLKKLGAKSFLTGEPITIESARECVADIVVGKVPVNVTIDKILAGVSKKYDISVEDLKGRRRTKEVARARHIAVYIIKKLTEIPLTNIAKVFDRDHTTIMSSIDFVEHEIEENPSTEQEINDLIREIK